MKNMLHIRELCEADLHLLPNFMYEAIFQPEGSEPLPRNILEKPEIARYYHNWGQPGDFCLIGEVNGQPAGAVWVRLLSGKGYGSIDASTPELAIALFPQYRNRGYGTQLLVQMLHRLQGQGVQQVSLHVEKANYAVSMYRKTGFTIVGEDPVDYTMLRKLSHG